MLESTTTSDCSLSLSSLSGDIISLQLFKVLSILPLLLAEHGKRSFQLTSQASVFLKRSNMRMNQLLVQLVECTSIILISINCINCEPIATLASSPRIPSIQGDDVKTNSKLSSVTKAPDSTSVTWSAYNISSHSPVTSGYNISSPSTVTNVTISSTATSPFSFSSSSPSSSSFSPSSASNVSATSSSPASPASSLANHLPPPLSVISSFNAKGKFHSHSFEREK